MGIGDTMLTRNSVVTLLNAGWLQVCLICAEQFGEQLQPGGPGGCLGVTLVRVRPVTKGLGA